MILVTGATGHVGRALVARLRAEGVEVVATARSPAPTGTADTVAADLFDRDIWLRLLEGAEAVVHLAAFNPRRGTREAADAGLMIGTNVEASVALARDAARAGVTRFVFASSIRVYGAARPHPFRETDPLAPEPGDAYARSKAEAEAALADALSGTRTRLTILRPPVVYGAGRGGVFGALARAVDAGWPIPLASLACRRSVIARDNLVDAIVAVLRAPQSAGRTFNVSDGPPVTYAELVRMIAAARGRPARLVAVPPALLRLSFHLPRAGDAFRHALSDCILDDRAIRRDIGWTPPLSTADAMREAYGKAVAQ